MDLIDRQAKLWQFLPSEQRELIEDCEKLIADAQSHPQKLSDYSYLVFPVAKMYEGFLKKLFLDLGLVSQERYESELFRIGSALNPNLPQHLKIESLYDQVLKHLKNQSVVDGLWQAWKRGRNGLFHYFPSRLERISLGQAQEVIGEIIQAMDLAVRHSYETNGRNS